VRYASRRRGGLGGGVLMLERNDEWALCRRHMTLETLAVVSDDQSVRHKAIVAA